jgi:hypothetical protein
MVETTPVMLEREKAENMRRAFEGNERVYFHENGTLAVWYGGATVNIFDAETFEEVDMFTVTEGFRDSTISETEEAVHRNLINEGFRREGRDNSTTTQLTKKQC